MEYELERIEEAPPSPPPSPEPEPLRPDFAEGAAKAPRQRHEATGPAGEHQRRLAAYRMERDVSISQAQRDRIAFILSWGRRLLVVWCVALALLMVGAGLVGAGGMAGGASAAVIAVAAGGLGVWWLRWLRRPAAAALAPLPPRPPPMPQNGLATVEELLAEKTWQSAVRGINDAVAEQERRWRTVTVQLWSALFGLFLMSLPAALLIGSLRLWAVLLCLCLGWVVMAPVAWIIAERSWGMIRSSLLCLLAAWLLMPLAMAVVGFFPLALYALQGCMGLLVGWVLGLHVTMLERNAMQRTG